MRESEVKSFRCSNFTSRVRFSWTLLGPFLDPVSVKVEHCGLALEEFEVILPWEMQLNKLFTRFLEALFGLRWILFLCSWAPVSVSIIYERGVSPWSTTLAGFHVFLMGSCAYMAWFLCSPGSSLVCLALVILSHFELISNFFLVLWWLNLTRKCGFKHSAIQMVMVYWSWGVLFVEPTELNLCLLYSLCISESFS